MEFVFFRLYVEKRKYLGSKHEYIRLHWKMYAYPDTTRMEENHAIIDIEEDRMETEFRKAMAIARIMAFMKEHFKITEKIPNPEIDAETHRRYQEEKQYTLYMSDKPVTHNGKPLMITTKKRVYAYTNDKEAESHISKAYPDIRWFKEEKELDYMKKELDGLLFKERKN